LYSESVNKRYYQEDAKYKLGANYFQNSADIVKQWITAAYLQTVADVFCNGNIKDNKIKDLKICITEKISPAEAERLQPSPVINNIIKNQRQFFRKYKMITTELDFLEFVKAIFDKNKLEATMKQIRQGDEIYKGRRVDTIIISSPNSSSKLANNLTNKNNYYEICINLDKRMISEQPNIINTDERKILTYFDYCLSYQLYLKMQEFKIESLQV
jgi:hypothetical protein